MKINETRLQHLRTNLKSLMRKKDITIAKLARQLDFPRITIARIFSGQVTEPRKTTLQKIADYFDVKVDALWEADSSVNESRSSLLIPILTWEMLLIPKATYETKLTDWKYWQLVSTHDDYDLSNDSFVLKSGQSQYPRYPLDTLLFIDPKEKPLDGDIVVVKQTSADETDISCRELIIDAQNKYLVSIKNPNITIAFNPEVHTILGVVILTQFVNKRNK